MKHQIFKFHLGIHPGPQLIAMPNGAKVLSAQVQDDMPRMWAIVDPNAEPEERSFCVVPTGRPFDLDGKSFIATVQTPPFVWHLFEVLK